MIKKIAVGATIGVATEAVKQIAEMANDPNVQEVGAKMKSNFSAPLEASKVKKEQKVDAQKLEMLKIELGGHYLKHWLETDEVAEGARHYVSDIRSHFDQCLAKLQLATVAESVNAESKAILAELKKLDELSAKAKVNLSAFYCHEYEKTQSCEPAFEHLHQQIYVLSASTN